MKAILLAAGIGDRLHPITDSIPKCLIEIYGKTLLERHFQNFKDNNINEVVIVVGHLKDRIISQAGDNYNGIPVKYIDNEKYRDGSIYSLYLARDEIEHDCIIMDADVICHPDIFKMLVETNINNCFLMDNSAEETGEEMMLGAVDGRVYKIDRTLGKEHYDEYGEGVGFLKLKGEDGTKLKDILEYYINKGENKYEYEHALNIFIKDVHVGYEVTKGLPWTEVDFKEDIERAEEVARGFE